MEKRNNYFYLYAPSNMLRTEIITNIFRRENGKRNLTLKDFGNMSLFTFVRLVLSMDEAIWNKWSDYLIEIDGYFDDSEDEFI